VGQAIEMSVVIEQHATKLHTEAEASQDLLQHEAVAIAFTIATAAATVWTICKRDMGPGLHGGFRM